MNNIVFTTEYDKKIKIIMKSQAKINNDIIKNGGTLPQKRTFLGITKPYIKNIEWNPSSEKRKTDNKRKFKKLHIKIIFRQEIVMCNEMDFCKLMIIYKHELEHTKDNILIFDEFSEQIKKNKKTIKLINSLFRWKSINEAIIASNEIEKEITTIFNEETINMARSLDTIETYNEIDKDITLYCQKYNNSKKFLQNLPSMLTLGLLAKGRGERGNTDPRSRNTKINNFSY